MAHTHRLLLASFVFFFLFSMVVKVIAAPLYNPGDTLDPTCAPGAVDCTVQIIPSQTGNSGKYLTTDGTTASWGTVASNTFSNGLTLASSVVKLGGTLTQDTTFDFNTRVVTWSGEGEFIISTNIPSGFSNPPNSTFDLTNSKILLSNSQSGVSTSSIDIRSDVIYVTGNTNFPSLTASRAVYTNSDKTLASSATTATELGYVSGVTSAIQTQLNAKQASGTYVTAVTADLPLTSSGGTTPNLTIAVANTSTDGIINSTDWNTFNNKVSSPWATSGSNAYFNTGNVGIGTTNPYLNDVDGFFFDSDSRMLSVVSNSVSRDSGLFLRTGDYTNEGLDLWVDGSDGRTYIDSRANDLTKGFYFRAATSGTPVNVMTVLPAGIALNTSNPLGSVPTGFDTSTGSAALRVNVNPTANTLNRDVGLFLRSYDDTEGLDIWYDGKADTTYFDSRNTSATGDIVFRVATAGAPANMLSIGGDGYVGIGTVTPTNKLQVSGGDIFLDYNRQIRGGTSDSVYGHIELYNGSTGALTVQARGGNELLLNPTNGNGSNSSGVSIGNSDPLATFHVEQGTGTYSLFGGASLPGTAGSYTGIALGHAESGGYMKSAIVQEQVGDANARGSIHILNDSTADSSNVTLADAKLSITYNGYVGINNPTPLYKLDIIGANENGYTTKVKSTISSLFNQFESSTGTGEYGIYNDTFYFQALDTLSNGIMFYPDSAGNRTVQYLPSGEIRQTYDASNYLSTTVASAGEVTFNATGASAGFTFSDGITASSTVTFSGIGTANGAAALCIDAGVVTIASSSCTVPSALRFKHNVEDLSGNLDKVLALRPVSYISNNDNSQNIGFIAEEVASIENRLVSYNTLGEVMGLNYAQFAPLFAGAINELDLKVNPLLSLSTEDTGTLGYMIKNFLADFENTINDLYAKIIHSDKIETKELCVGSTCVTEVEFLQLIQGGGSTPSPSPAPDPIPDPAPEPDPTPAPDPAPEPEVTPEPEPEPTPAPEPTPDPAPEVAI